MKNVSNNPIQSCASLSLKTLGVAKISNKRCKAASSDTIDIDTAMEVCLCDGTRQSFTKRSIINEIH